MASEWRWRTLGELTDNFDSLRVPVKAPDRRPGQYPYYGASGVVDHVDEYLYDGEYLLIAEDGENLKTRTTPVAFLACGRFWVNNHAHVVRGNIQADTRFLMYALAAADISGYLSGSAMPKLTQASLNRIPLFVPELSEQRRIASILGALDDKIELNRRMSQTLESMARALFKSWFVDFDPVHAKGEGRHLRMEGSLADCWPRTLVPSPIGLIPEGWNLERLGTQIDVLRGFSYGGAGLSAEGMPMHNLNSVYEGGGYKNSGIKFYQGDYDSGHFAEPGDVLVANTEQGHDRLLIGYAGIVPSRYPKGLFSHHLYRVRPMAESSLSQPYVEALLNSDKMHDTVSRYANGTTVNMLPAAALERPLVAVPPVQLIKAFTDLATTVRHRAECARDQSRSLSRICDSLVPALLPASRFTVHAANDQVNP